MDVIVALHGGDPDDPTAHSEFQEIKENVLEDVRFLSSPTL